MNNLATKSDPMKETEKMHVSIMYVGNIGDAMYSLATLSNLHVNLKQHTNYLKAIDDLKYNNYKPDYIVCDFDQKETNALDIFQQMTGLIPTATRKIILITREPDKRMIEEAVKLNIHDIIKFPFNKEDLSDQIKWDILSKTSSKDTRYSFGKKLKNQLPKRVFDLTFSLLAILILSPLLLAVTILIKLDSKGPVFYISKRVGRGYKIFDFYKFRTMRTDADKMIDAMKDQNQYKIQQTPAEEECSDCKALGHPCSSLLVVDSKTVCEAHYQRNKNRNSTSFVKFKDDPRITKLGQFLRKTSIDELPQLINIIKGDMSFVGNRPLPLYEAEQLTTDDFSERFSAPAGLTGLWQVLKRGKSEMSELERKNLDNQYARSHTFIGDIVLILKTVPALAQKENV